MNANMEEAFEEIKRLKKNGVGFDIAWSKRREIF